MRVEVGVRELRENLSDWLDRAAAGEEILVTERGKPKAVITAAESAWDRMVREGRITPRTGTGPRRRCRRPLKWDRRGPDADRLSAVYRPGQDPVAGSRSGAGHGRRRRRDRLSRFVRARQAVPRRAGLRYRARRLGERCPACDQSHLACRARVRARDGCAAADRYEPGAVDPEVVDGTFLSESAELIEADAASSTSQPSSESDTASVGWMRSTSRARCSLCEFGSTLVSWDERQRSAARAEGLPVYPERRRPQP